MKNVLMTEPVPNAIPIDTQSSDNNGEKEYSIKNVPRLPTEFSPFAPFNNVFEMHQRGPLFKGPGSTRETGRYKVRASDDDTVKRAKKFAAEQTVKHILLRQQQQQQRLQTDFIKKQHALQLMCRIYVGSINFEMNETMLKQAFQPFGPVKSVSLTIDPVTNRHKGFGFLEYELPEAAQLSIEQMNGVPLSGRNIKVGRPSNMPQAQPIIDQLTDEAKNYNRIYIASIHPNISEKDIQSVFEAFGKIKSCILSKDTATNKHKGYGFIEYETSQATQDAITSMNLFDLGGQHLRVGKAITPPEGLLGTASAVVSPMPDATALAVASITAQLRLKETETNPQKYETTVLEDPPVSAGPTKEPELQEHQEHPSISLVLPTTFVQSTPSQPNEENKDSSNGADDSSTILSHNEELSVKGREQRHLLMQKLNQRRLDSCVCVLHNMVAADEVDDALQQEITEECSKYGNVVRVVIYTEHQNEDENADQIVKIFVEFEASKQAEKTVDSLNGRWFAGRMIKAELYDQAAYQADDLSG